MAYDRPLSEKATRPSPLTTWSAWVPIAIPLLFAVLALRRVLLYGLVREADEGVEAHLFQLLIPFQVLISGYFALTWLPRAPRIAAVIFGAQVAAAAAIFGAVYWLEHTAV